MSTSQKAEVSTEFIVFFGILLLFFVFFVAIVGINNNDINESNVFASASNILDTVVNEINTASRIDGYYSEFTTPEKLSDGETYNITCNEALRMVIIEWDQGKSVTGNIVTNVTGNVSTGRNVIKNINGKVNISES